MGVILNMLVSSFSGRSLSESGSTQGVIRRPHSTARPAAGSYAARKGVDLPTF
jgi:hypothetical protein